jgi:hypothetical protein
MTAEWLEPWWEVARARPDLAASYERELRAELGTDHPLFDTPVQAVGTRDGSDDVLFRLLDGSGRVAVVHLTWARRPERSPWPTTEFFADMQTFAERRMRRDHDERRR